eukprot:1159918-Pelagomonas_calceolata.AAC.4
MQGGGRGGMGGGRVPQGGAAPMMLHPGAAAPPHPHAHPGMGGLHQAGMGLATSQLCVTSCRLTSCACLLVSAPPHQCDVPRACALRAQSVQVSSHVHAGRSATRHTSTVSEAFVSCSTAGSSHEQRPCSGPQSHQLDGQGAR